MSANGERSGCRTYAPVRDGQPSVMFLYPSRPTTVASTIDIAIARLKVVARDTMWYSWREIPASGRMVSALVRAEISSCTAVVVDLTSYNENVLFEVGLALGLGVPILPLRDVSFAPPDGLHYADVGLLNELACFDFRNSDDIVDRLRHTVIPDHLALALPGQGGPNIASNRISVISSALRTEGVRQLAMALDRAGVDTQTFVTSVEPDHLRHFVERNQGSAGVVAHLLDENRRHVIELAEPSRRGVRAENARAILLAALSEGAGIPTLLLQEGYRNHPVDFRPLVLPYSDPGRIAELVNDFLNAALDPRSVAPERLNQLAYHDLECTAADEAASVLAALWEVPPSGFRACWRTVCVPFIESEDSFRFIRTRTRTSLETLSLVKAAAERAISAGRTLIGKADIYSAIQTGGRKALVEAFADSGVQDGGLRPMLLALVGADEVSGTDELVERFTRAGLNRQDAYKAIALLVDRRILAPWDPAVESVVSWMGDPLSDGMIFAIHPVVHAPLRIKAYARAAIYPPVWSLA
jgi:hypothetical protein